MSRQNVGRNVAVRQQLENFLDQATDKDLVDAVTEAIRIRMGTMFRRLGPDVRRRLAHEPALAKGLSHEETKMLLCLEVLS
jgi:hypothetical protein